MKYPPPLKHGIDKEPWQSKNLDNAETISVGGVCVCRGEQYIAT